MGTTFSAADTDTAALTAEALELMDRAGTVGLSDEESDRLMAVSTELDRRGVVYEGKW